LEHFRDLQPPGDVMGAITLNAALMRPGNTIASASTASVANDFSGLERQKP